MLHPVPTADSSAEVAEWWRLVDLCLPSHDDCGAITFTASDAEHIEADWDRWLTGVFLPVLHPSFAALQEAATLQDIDALLAGDRALGAALSAEAARTSLVAGRHLLLSFDPPQGAKLLEKMREAAAMEKSFGHLATVFAVRSRIFHLPFFQAAGALLLAECVLGADAAGLTLPADRSVALLQRALERVSALPAAQLMAV